MFHNSARDQGKSGRGTVEPRKRRQWRMRPTVVVLEDRRLLSTFTVTNNASSGAGSLPSEIGLANTAGGANTIVFGSFFNTPQTITLGGTQLELSTANESVTITGPAAGVTVSGNNASRVFLVDPTVTASISGLTISGGNAGAFDNNGGGLANFGTTTLTNCTVSGNSAGFRAGGLYNGGTLKMTNCTVSGNSATGGGVDNETYFNQGATAMLTNCTVSGNSGGGLVTHGAPVTLTNTIVAGNAGTDIFAGVVGDTGPDAPSLSGTNNLIGTGSAGALTNGINGNLIGVTDPLLAPLGNYGGPTQTVALLPGSPAINAGTNGPGIPTTDQRGLGRVGAVDIGAFESQGFTLTVVAGSSPQTSNIGTAFANPLAVSVTANNPVEPVNGGVVTFVAKPASTGASAFFPASSAVVANGVIANGQAAVTAAPNNMDGSYHVVASASGSSPATFNLTNTGPVFTHLIVNTTSDSLFPGVGLLSLREAIAFANADSLGNSNITFDSKVFGLPQTITLTGTQLELSNTSETETITGPNKGVTVSAAGLSRVFQVDALVTASISGLTITGGTTTANGGGLANFGTTTLNNCTISGNSATSYGGGLYNGGTLKMTNCTVSGNSAATGGGVDNGTYLNQGATSTLTNCTVSRNSASRGGGVFISHGSSGTVTLTNCTVSGNTATGVFTGGGGVYNQHICTLTNCTISGNSAAGGGGGVENFITSGGKTIMVIATNCTISGNSASTGGGLYNFVGTSTLTNCTVSGNSATGNGGGLGNNYGAITSTNCTVSDNSAGYAGGGLSNVLGGTATLTNCTVSGNSASKGGGVYNGLFQIRSTTLTMTNCTVSGNSATGNDGGGGVNNCGSTATLTDCTVNGNSATGNGGGLCNSNATGFFGGPATATLTNCTVSGNSTTGNGGGVSTGGFGYYGYHSSGTTTLTNCTVSGNSATGNGGGINNASLGNTTVTGTNVKDNSAVAGGGLFNQGTLNVASSNIISNRARGGAGGNGIGGGICSSGGSVALSSSALTANTATGGAGASGQAGGDGIGGGLALENDATATITNTSFLGNLAEGAAGGAGAQGGDGIGGGIAVAIGGASDTSSVSLSNSLLSLNVAQGGKGGSGANGGNGEGGGAFVGAAGSAALDQTDILLYLALGGLGYGGGANGDGVGGGLYVTPGGVVTLHKSTVALNFASFSNNNIYGAVTYV